MKLRSSTSRRLLSLVFSTSILAALVIAVGSPYALGQSASTHQQTSGRIRPSAQELPCYLWAVDVADIPFFDARWRIGYGNSVQLRIKGNFACATMPSVSDPLSSIEGTCTRTNGVSEAVYPDPRPLSGETNVHVGFNEWAAGIVYHLSFSEFGTPLFVVGY
jgi:hypothetical protein